MLELAYHCLLVALGGWARVEIFIYEVIYIIYLLVFPKCK
jgi:hypothetical protein